MDEPMVMLDGHFRECFVRTTTCTTEQHRQHWQLKAVQVKVTKDDIFCQELIDLSILPANNILVATTATLQASEHYPGNEQIKNDRYCKTPCRPKWEQSHSPPSHLHRRRAREFQSCLKQSPRARQIDPSLPLVHQSH
eukprot:CAMPEP_0115578862 /NCGR_PEP_ID=MMETSP0272-20121206/3812_1 /TAXON_ID=71861 /ORGANISM="Scrippsiella trochoidea, Strain CCMP3099" /LENGTH=137 /DNA_ID=CAMNT_0003013729 /DNA_START=414 /DNA_END=827 /DNA_ORIENTATION=+